MATLLRVPEDLDQKVREAAKSDGASITDWWLDAGRQKLERKELDIAAAAEIINADPVMRRVLDRLAQ